MSSAETSRVARALASGSDELALFHRTLAELCRADVPLPKAFRMLQGDLKRGRFRDGVAEMADEVESGVPLGDAYRKRKQAFPALYCALVEAGMVSGDLPGVLDEISKDAARRAAIAEKVRKALAYPLMAAGFVLVLGVLLVTVVGPTLMRFPEEAGVASPLPYAAGALAALLVLAAVALAFGWVRGPLDKAGRRGFRFPGLGRIRLYAAKASALATLGLLLRRAVPLPTALALAGEACEDEGVRKELRAKSEASSLRDALSGVLEPTLFWLVAAAEGTEKAPQALDDIADVYTRRLERAVDRLATVLTPAAELALGVVVFVLAYSFLVPFFEFADGMFRF